jgi:hypothetical protein
MIEGAPTRHTGAVCASVGAPELWGSAESSAIVRQFEVHERPDWYDAGRIDIAMAAVIVAFDVIEADGVGDPWYLVDREDSSRGSDSHQCVVDWRDQTKAECQRLN